MLTVNMYFHRFDLFFNKIIKTLESSIVNANERNKQQSEH